MRLAGRQHVGLRHWRSATLDMKTDRDRTIALKTMLPRLNVWDAVLMPVTVLASLGIIFNTSQIGRIPNFDLNSYIALAEDPLKFFDAQMTGWHAQRVLGSLIVWGLRNLNPGISIDLGFRIVSGACFVAFAVLFYSSLRVFRVSAFVAFGTTLFAMVATWPMTYSLGNIYQATDALVYPLALLIILAALANRPGLLLALSLLGVLARQNLFVLAVFAYVYLIARTRRKGLIIGLAIVIAAFGLSSRYAGGRLGSAGHLADVFLNFSGAFSRAMQVDLWDYFTPFGLVLLDRRALKYAVRYWWVTLFGVITVGQALAMGLVDANVGRIVAQGIFPAFLVAGIIIDERMRCAALKVLYALMPLLYGNEHLAFVKHRWAPIWGDRRWVMLLIVLLVITDMLWRRYESVRTAVASGAAGGGTQVVT